MKKLLFAAVIAVTLSGNVFAQDVDMGADVVSSYIWRGGSYGGPSIQPWLELGFGDLAVGAWGSFDFVANAPGENDYYVSYSLGDLSVGFTDYYYRTTLSETSSDSGSHAVELNLGYTIGALSLSGNYILNEAPMAGSQGGDVYIEVGYTLGNVDLFVGAGNGWHTVDPDEFTVVNIGLSASKDIKITEDFSIPVTGAIVVNPDADVSYFYVGFSL
jgi:hypothetical protein